MSALLPCIWLVLTSSYAADRTLHGELGVSTGPLYLIGARDLLSPAGGARVNGGLRIGSEGVFQRYGLAMDAFMENGLYYDLQSMEFGTIQVPGDLHVLRLAPQIGLGYASDVATVSGRLEAGMQRWRSPVSEEYWSKAAGDLGQDLPAAAGAGLWAGAGVDAGIVTTKRGMSVGVALDLDWFLGSPLSGLAWSPRLAINLPL
jgi:hypothetical protein